MRIILTFVLIFFSVILTVTGQSETVTQFENKLEEHFKSYESNPREKVTELGGGWVKERQKMAEDYSYDIQETNSLVSPYKGFLEFTVIRFLTDFHKTKEAAQSDNDFIKTDQRTHKHTYLFQKGNWVVSERKNKNNFLNEWFDCSEQENPTDIHGCWENNF